MDFQLPEIKVIPIRNLILHETEEPKRTKCLEERIVSDGFLKNPVIAARISRNTPRYLLLDGVHRVTALKNLGVSDVVAQVVDYSDDDVKVEAWCHLIYDIRAEDLIAGIKENRNLTLEPASRKHAKELLQERRIVCCVFLKDKRAFVVRSKEDLESRVSALTRVVNVYYGVFKVKRGSEIEASRLLKEHKAATALMMTHVYEKKEILALANNMLRLPPGVTRHIVPLRILGFHVDLGLLKFDLALKDKNRLIQQMLDNRIGNGKTRFYRESVLLFDD